MTIPVATPQKFNQAAQMRDFSQAEDPSIVIAKLNAEIEAEEMRLDAEDLASVPRKDLEKGVLKAIAAGDADREKLLSMALEIQAGLMAGPEDCRVENESEPRSWPVLSPAALPDGVVADFINLACENSEADPAAVLTTFLVRFGIEAGSGPHVMIGETKHTAHEFTVIVGDSAKARKGTSAGPVKSIFSGIEGCKVSPGPLSSGEGIIYAVRDEIREWRVDKKTCVGAWVVTDPGVDDKRLFILDEEFSSALSATKREGNTLSSILRCLWDSGNAEPLTKSNKIKTTNSHIGVVTHTTLFELKKRLTENEQLNGFGNRFLWVCAKRNGIVPIPRQIDEHQKWKITSQIADRLSKARTAGVMAFTSDAEQLWVTEYPRLSMAHEGLSGCMVNRAEAHVIRLSLIYALIAGHSSIEVDDLTAALSFWRYCYESALYVFGGSYADSAKNKIFSALQEADGNCMTKSDIRTAVFSGHISKERLSEVIEQMADAGIVSVESEPTGGAPRTIVKLSCAKSVLSSLSPGGEESPDLKTLITLKKLKTQDEQKNTWFADDSLPDYDIELDGGAADAS